MKLVDVHCHLDDPQFSADLASVIKRAKDAGVVAIITNALALNAYQPLLDLSAHEPIIKVALGIYPDNARDQDAHDTSKCLDFISKHKHQIVAIGEIGLDYKYTTEDAAKAKQRKVFLAQLELARRIKKPVIIHTRDAEEDVLKLLEEHGQEDVILHCFCGTEQQVEFARDCGFFFSIPVRAKTSKHFQMIIQKVPLNKLLTETDAPYLHYKQERNEPANVATTIEVIAKIKGMAPEEVANNILANYIKLFSRG